MIRRLRGLLERVDRFQRRHRRLSQVVAVVKKFGEDRAGKLGALVAYYSFFSLFPLLLALVTVGGFVLSGHPGLRADLVDSTLGQFPVVGDQIKVNSLRGNGLALLIGMVTSVWAGLAALEAMQNAMNEIWDVPRKDRPNFLVSRLRASVMLLVFGGAVFALVLVSAVGAYGRRFGLVGVAVSAAMGFTLATGLFATAFRVLPSRVMPWRTVWPGALVAAAGFLALQVIGGIYVARLVAGASEAYGVFAVVIGLLSWLHLQAQVALFAAEVNAVRDLGLWPRSLFGDALTEADKRALCRYAKSEERRDDEDISMRIVPRASATNDR